MITSQLSHVWHISAALRELVPLIFDNYGAQAL